MTTIVDIRGTSGSGKSWVVHQLMRATAFEPVRAVPPYEPAAWRGKVVGHAAPERACYVVGEYTTNCSGADNIRSQEEVRRRVRDACREGFRLVILEGAIISTIHSKYEALYAEMKVQHGARAEVVHLNTPLGNCISAVQFRRVAAGRPPGFNEENTRSRYDSIARTCEKFRAGGVARVSVMANTELLERCLAVVRGEEFFNAF